MQGHALAEAEEAEARHKRFSIAPGKTKSVLVKISKKGRRLIKRKHKLKVSATAKAKNAMTARRTVTLRPARKKRKR